MSRLTQYPRSNTETYGQNRQKEITAKCELCFGGCIVYWGFDIVGPKQNVAPCASKSQDATGFISITLCHSDMRTAGYFHRQTVAWWSAHEHSMTNEGLYSPEDKTSHNQISWIGETESIGFGKMISLQNVIDASITLLRRLKIPKLSDPWPSNPYVLARFPGSGC